MSCARYKLLISRYLDDDLSLRERDMLMAHLVNCPTCAATLARYRGMETSLRKLPQTQPSPAVRDNLLHFIRKDGSTLARDDRRSAKRTWLSWLSGFADAGIPSVTRRAGMAMMPAVFAVALGGLLMIYASHIGLIASGNNVAQEPTIAAPLASAQFVGYDDASYTPRPSNPQSIVSLEQVLRRAKDEYPVHLPLPAYIPAGMRLEHFSLNPGAPYDAAGDMEVAFKAQDGNMVRIRHGASSAVRTAPINGSRMVVGGREWLIERHPALSQNSAQAYIIFTRQNDEVVVLDAVLPLDELMRIVESIQWTGEEK